MMTLATAFKNVYGKVLEEYGFKKVKSKQPYWGRMVGDEILQVITYKNENIAEQHCKAFSVLSGIATVYRAEIDLDESPRDIKGHWINDTAWVYSRTHIDDYDDDYRRSIMWNKYQTENEQSLLEAMENSLSSTKEIILPVLDKVKDIKSCVEYYQIMNKPILHIYVDELLGNRWSGYKYREGLLNFKVYDSQEYEKESLKHHRLLFESERYKLSIGKSSYTKELLDSVQKKNEESMLNQIRQFKELESDLVGYDDMIQELERRKQHNLERLKAYGFEI